MLVERIALSPTAALADALVDFEREFTYPLGPDRSFRISHGDDYPRFFRAIGDGCCFVAIEQGRVLGTLGVAICPLMSPNGRERIAAYIGDLKITSVVRGRSVLWRLTKTAQEWARPKVDCAFGVVMDGTLVDPQSYTGRAGIPGFRQIGSLRVLRFSTSLESPTSRDRFVTGASEGLDCYRRLSQGRYALSPRAVVERSEMEPLWLVHPDGSACGRLEDTRKAKRLFDTGSDEEMHSAHLSCFAYSQPDAAVQLLRVAENLAARQGFPSLFAAVDGVDLHGLKERGAIDGQVATAFVFAAGLEAGPEWNINTSEI